jgi:hypothetical protein
MGADSYRQAGADVNVRQTPGTTLLRQTLAKIHLVPAVGLESKAGFFVVVREWHQWLANKG